AVRGRLAQDDLAALPGKAGVVERTAALRVGRRIEVAQRRAAVRDAGSAGSASAADVRATPGDQDEARAPLGSDEDSLEKSAHDGGASNGRAAKTAPFRVASRPAVPACARPRTRRAHAGSGLDVGAGAGRELRPPPAVDGLGDPRKDDPLERMSRRLAPGSL